VDDVEPSTIILNTAALQLVGGVLSGSRGVTTAQGYVIRTRNPQNHKTHKKVVCDVLNHDVADNNRYIKNYTTFQCSTISDFFRVLNDKFVALDESLLPHRGKSGGHRGLNPLRLSIPVWVRGK